MRRFRRSRRCPREFDRALLRLLRETRGQSMRWSAERIVSWLEVHDYEAESEREREHAMERCP